MNIALYMRLSKEDNELSDSKSITSQKMYLNDYIKRFNYDNVYEYVDDGYSGTNFNRPSFKKLLNDIEKQKIDTIITKDSSRLGRNISWVTFYVEEYFPSKKIRYIAIDDNYDSFANDSLSSEMLTFKSMFNDYYCKDISKKIKSSLHIKKIEGKFTGWKAPYGYLRSARDYHELVVDEKVRKTIEMIFNLATKDNTPSAIAKILNEKKIASPAVYAGLRNSKWTTKTVKDILQNPTYIGNMAQGKRKKINHKIKKSISIPPEQWIIKENTHEPIITKEVFSIVQKKLAKYPNIKNNRIKNQELINMMYCKECGSKIGLNYRKDNCYCVCNNYKKNYRNKSCTPHTFNYQELRNVIMNELNDEIRIITKIDVESIRSLIARKKLLENRIMTAEDYFLEQYIKLKNNIISQKQYHYDRINKEKEIKSIYEELSKTLKELKNKTAINQKRKQLLSNKELHLKMISKIYLAESGEIELLLNYSHH